MVGFGTLRVLGFIHKNNYMTSAGVQNRALRVIGGYDWYTRKEQLYLHNEMSRPRSFVKTLDKKLCVSLTVDFSLVPLFRLSSVFLMFD